MNEWLEQIKNAGFEADVIFTKDGDKMISLYWKDGKPNMTIFRDVDADRCLATALQFALNYDAYVTNAALCGHPQV